MNLPSFLLENAVSLVKNLIKYQISTPLRVIHFISQLHHESGGFKYFGELGGKSYFKKYEFRKDLGNTQAGDGYKFRGRGLIQITGRNNYKKFSDYSGIDILSNPDLASTPEIAIQIACWFWTQGSAWGNLNKYADKNDIVSITKGINGGINGLADRKKNYTFYKQFDLFGILKKKAVPAIIKKVSYSFYNPFTRVINFGLENK